MAKMKMQGKASETPRLSTPTATEPSPTKIDSMQAKPATLEARSGHDPAKRPWKSLISYTYRPMGSFPIGPQGFLPLPTRGTKEAYGVTGTTLLRALLEAREEVILTSLVGDPQPDGDSLQDVLTLAASSTASTWLIYTKPGALARAKDRLASGSWDAVVRKVTAAGWAVHRQSGENRQLLRELFEKAIAEGRPVSEGRDAADADDADEEEEEEEAEE